MSTQLGDMGVISISLCGLFGW